jgi:hypothetical protein
MVSAMNRYWWITLYKRERYNYGLRRICFEMTKIKKKLNFLKKI